jgi:hypothetical protein
MEFKELNLQTALNGEFGPDIQQKWNLWQQFYNQRKQSYPIELDNDTLKITNEVKEKGFIILKDFFDKDLLKNLNNETQDLIKKGKLQKSMGGSGVGPEEQIRDNCLWTTIDQPQYNIDSFFDVAFHDDLVVLAAHYFGCLPAFGTCNLRKSYVNDLQEDHTQIYHQDPNSPDFIKMFFYLNDVDKNGGPFCIVEGSHKNKFEGCYSKYRWDTEEIDKIYGKEKIKYLTANVGDLIIANTNCFHRGTKPYSSDRTMLTLDWVIHPEDFKPPKFKIKNEKVNNVSEWKRPIFDYLIKS